MITSMIVHADFSCLPPFTSQAIAVVNTDRWTATASTPIDKYGLSWQNVSAANIEKQIDCTIPEPERSEIRTGLLYLLESWPKVRNLREPETPAERVIREVAGIGPNDWYGYVDAQMPRGETIRVAKRLGIYKSDVQDGWWVGYNPRNGNAYDEGTWAEWVELAEAILERQVLSR